MSKSGKIGALISLALALKDQAEVSLKKELHDLYSQRYISNPPEIGKFSERGLLTRKQKSLIVRRVEPREGPKIGRNEPCSCGSEKKYKNCCLNKK